MLAAAFGERRLVGALGKAGLVPPRFRRGWVTLCSEVGELVVLIVWRRQVAAAKSGDKSPHSKPWRWAFPSERSSQLSLRGSSSSDHGFVQINRSEIAARATSKAGEASRASNRAVTRSRTPASPGRSCRLSEWAVARVERSRSGPRRGRARNILREPASSVTPIRKSCCSAVARSKVAQCRDRNQGLAARTLSLGRQAPNRQAGLRGDIRPIPQCYHRQLRRVSSPHDSTRIQRVSRFHGTAEVLQAGANRASPAG